MKGRKWAVVAGGIAAGVVLLIALGFGVAQISAQEPAATPVPAADQPVRENSLRARAARWGWQLRGHVATVAEVLGLSDEELITALREGKSVADVAAEQGVPLEDVVQALLAEPRRTLEQAVSNGRITQEEADRRLAEMEDRIIERLEQSAAAPRRAADSSVRQAAGWGWQARACVDTVAEVLGLSDEELIAALREGKSVADVAAEQGVPLDDVVQALLAGPRERLDQAVSNGRITQEEADRRLAQIERRINAALETPGTRLDKSPAARAARAQRAGWQLRGHIDTVAEVLGLSDEELIAALREGKSVADVAAEQGIPLEDVVEALLAGQRERLDQAVSNGRITQEEADRRLAEMEERITERLQEPIRPLDRSD